MPNRESARPSFAQCAARVARAASPHPHREPPPMNPVVTNLLAVTAAQFAVTYLPPLQAMLGTEPVPFLDGLVIVGTGAVFFAIIEIEKQIRLGLQRR